MQAGLNGPKVASQTDQQAGTAAGVFVTPSVQHYHPAAAKAWAHVLMSGTTPILITGFNVATVSNPATGMYRFAYTNPVSSAFYSAVASVILSTGSSGSEAINASVGVLTSVAFAVYIRANTGGTLNSGGVGFNAVVFADSA